MRREACARNRAEEHLGLSLLQPGSGPRNGAAGCSNYIFFFSFLFIFNKEKSNFKN